MTPPYNNQSIHKYTGNGNGTHFHRECSQVFSSHLDYLSEGEYGAVAIIVAVYTSLEIFLRSVIINITSESNVTIGIISLEYS